jgi:transposase
MVSSQWPAVDDPRPPNSRLPVVCASVTGRVLLAKSACRRAASLCGVSPIEASSGKVVRHRLNRGGNRDANRSLHLICVVRMRVDERTRRYVARRTAEGKSEQEIMRCLKRYIAREIYRLLAPMAAASAPSAPRSQAT